MPSDILPQQIPVTVKPPPVGSIPSKQQQSVSSSGAVTGKNDPVKPSTPSSQLQGATPQVKDPPGVAVTQVGYIVVLYMYTEAYYNYALDLLLST